MIVAPGMSEKETFNIPLLLDLNQPFPAFRRENLFKKMAVYQRYSEGEPSG
jgi:hypothetical protein